ncbi:hypothetical protein PF050_11585 [Kosakonia pseudosacchari]|nr:hypothetical protein [Kosakonia pseudosacchari]WBU51512.1 hypothetical protein PF050_11585 [Kosakonia pseudosacchari]
MLARFNLPDADIANGLAGWPCHPAFAAPALTRHHCNHQPVCRWRLPGE